jgi:hypothetical protein
VAFETLERYFGRKWLLELLSRGASCRIEKRATLAQLVERLIRNQQVAGSIPAGGSIEQHPTRERWSLFGHFIVPLSRVLMNTLLGDAGVAGDAGIIDKHSDHCR